MMNKGKRWWLVAVLLGLLLICFGAEAKTTVEAWMYLTGANAEFMSNLAAEFEKQNPDIDIELVWMTGYYAAFDKLLVALAGGVGPNLALIEQSLAYALVKGNGAVDLTPYIEADPTMTMSDFDPVLRQTVTYDGRMYGIPYNVSTPVFYYNKDILLMAGLTDQPPKDRDTFHQIAKRTTVMQGDGTVTRHGFWLTAWRWLFEAWVGRAGGQIINDDMTQFVFDSPKVQEIMQFAQDMVVTERIAGYSSGATGAHQPFYNNKLTMFEYTTAGLRSIETNSQANGINLGVTTLPCFEKCYVPIGGANLMLINSGTQTEKDAAWRFLSYIVNPENLASFATLTGYMAPRRSARATTIFREYIRMHPFAMETYNQIEFAHARPQVPFWNTIQNDLINVLSPAMYVRKENFRPILHDLNNKANVMLREWLEKPQ